MEQQQTTNASSRQQQAANSRQMQQRIMGILQLIGAVLCIFAVVLANIDNDFYQLKDVAIPLILQILKIFAVLSTSGILGLLLSTAGGENEGSMKWNRLLSATTVASSLALLEIAYYFVCLTQNILVTASYPMFRLDNAYVRLCIFILIVELQICIGQVCLCLLHCGLFNCCKSRDTEAQSAEYDLVAAVETNPDPPMNATATSNDYEQQVKKSIE